MVTVVFTASEKQRRLQVSDARGSVIKTIMVPAGATYKTDMSAFAKGIYTINLDDGEQKLVRGLLKQ